MTLSREEKERLNLSMPVANDIKLGDVIAELQEGGGVGEPGPAGKDGETGPKGDPGTPGKDGTNGTDGATGPAGYGTKADYDALDARLTALEGGG